MSATEVLDDYEAGELSIEFEGLEPWDVLEWAIERFGDRLALSTAFQDGDVALVDMAYRIDPEVRVFSIDTGRLPQETHDLVEELRELGLTMTSGEADRPVEGPLSGHSYVITGTLDRYTRDEAKAALEALGAKVSDSVSKKTTGVIAGESPGAKLAKAEKAGVPVLGEAELATLLAQRG